MFCPFCGYQETVVKDSRVSEDGHAIRRRRHCPSCDSRFTTYERVQLKEFFVIKKSGEKEFFDLSKLKNSLKMALRKREFNSEDIDKLTSEIYQEIARQKESEIESDKIGELVMRSLKKIDQVAFVRFASVYKNFNKAEDFKKFIKNL